MTNETPAIAPGYSKVAPGQIATVVTCLEMLAPPQPSSEPQSGPFVVERWPSPGLDDYRALFRSVGESWMWVSRLTMTDEKLSAIVSDPNVEIYALTDGHRAVGLLELDFRRQDECELGYFGLVPDAIGKGAGRLLMRYAIDKAWSRPIRRFWVHTCHLDSPAALPFYQRSGFEPFRQMVEVMEDPRLTGLVPRTASPHVPLIEP